MVEALATCLLEPGDERALDSLKLCICGTGMLREATHEAFRARYGLSVRPRYGSTETLATAIDLGDGYVEGRVGRAISGVTISIMDPAGNRCPTGVAGSIAIRSPAAATQYVGDPEMSARVFRDGQVFPGDRGYLDDQGRLHVVGRSDIINIGGFKVDRFEVERVIRDALPVTDVVVMEGERAGSPAVRAVIEGDPALVTREAVIAACRAKLSNYKVPAQIEVFRKFRRDANGKALRSYFDARTPEREPAVPAAPGIPDGAEN
jgi:acyl-coenzyme A synthetase/AMP-(fatty) acid ligase